MSPRSEVVNVLTKAALAGMENCIEDATGDEIVSACFTLTKRAIDAVMVMHPECRIPIRHAVELLLMDCADPTQQN